MKAQIQRICSWILSATEGLVPPWDARGGKNTVCVPEQDLAWLLGVAIGLWKHLFACRGEWHYRSCKHRLGVKPQVCRETHARSWDPPATSLLSLALGSLSDPALTCHEIMFPDGSCVETSTQVAAPYPSSDFGPLPFVPDETLLNAAIQHLPILLYTPIQHARLCFAAVHLCTLFLFR